MTRLILLVVVCSYWALPSLPVGAQDGALPATSARVSTAPRKISRQILAHQKQKQLLPGVRADVHAQDLVARGLNRLLLDGEDCALYVKEPLTPQKIAALRGQGIDVHATYVPAVPGKHPLGFYLATVRYASLDFVQADPKILRLETTELLSEPQNDLGAIMTHVADVRNGLGVTARTGVGVKVAIADSGLDLTLADVPTPVEAFDMTTGTDPSTWGTDVANKVSPHGTHVVGTVLGRGTLSGGKYQGMAPDASLCFYKIGNDTNASASATDEIEAMNRAQAVGCKIFSMSYGGWDMFMDGSDPDSQAIDASVAAGMTCFVSAGNEQGSARHYSVDVAPGTTSPAFYYATTANRLPRGSVLYFFVIWRDGVPGDENITLACTNLGTSETLTIDTSDSSTRGTDGKIYALTTNQADGAAVNYDFTLQNTASSGNTPKVHVYDALRSGMFTSPDPTITITDPANADDAIAVGAWTHRTTWINYDGAGYYYPTYTIDTLAPFSSLGPRIDGAQKPNIVAPGAATISLRDSVPGLAATYSQIIDDDGLNLDGSGPADYYVMSGTSMASPHAAGLAALILEAHPTYTPSQLRAVLTSTASQADAPDYSVGYGLVDAVAAILHQSPPPTASLASAAPDATNASPIPVTVTLSDVSTDFTADDLSPTNATVTSFTGSGTDYAFDLNPNGQGTVSVTIGAGVFTNADGTSNTSATPLTRLYDSLAPTAGTVTPPAFARATPIHLSFSGAGDTGSGLARVDLWYKKGAGGTWTNSGLTAQTAAGSFSFTGVAGDDTYFFDLVATDVAGNSSAPAQDPGDGSTIYDTTAPTAVMTSTTTDPTDVSPIPVTVTLSEPSTDFAAEDIIPVNATVTNFTGSGTAYSFGLVPNSPGTVTATIAAGVFTDAAGNPNLAATPFSRTVEVLGVSVSPHDWSIGVVALNAVVESAAFVTDNTGSVAEDLTILGTDGAGGWLLQAAAGENAFRVDVDQNNDSTYDLVLSKSGGALAAGVAAGGTTIFGLKYTAPSADTMGWETPQDFMVTIRASRSVP